MPFDLHLMPFDFVILFFCPTWWRVLLILYVMPAPGNVNTNGVKIFLWWPSGCQEFLRYVAIVHKHTFCFLSFDNVVSYCLMIDRTVYVGTLFSWTSFCGALVGLYTSFNNSDFCIPYDANSWHHLVNSLIMQWQ